MDLDSVLSAIDRIGPERVAGVFAGGSAHAELASRAAAALGRPHADPDAISLCNDKHRLRAFLARKGLNSVDYQYVTTAPDAGEAVERLGRPVIVKPVSWTGSDGVRICRTPDEAILHAQGLLKRNPEGILAEKYIDAPQYSVEFFDGEPLIVKRDYVSDGPFPIIIGVDAPAALGCDHTTELEDYASSIIKEVGLSNGPSFMELRYSGADKYIIEINPRPALTSPIQIATTLGIDLASQCLKFACGIPYKRVTPKKCKGRAYAGRHVIRSGSSVRAIKGVEEARKVLGVKRISVFDSQFYRRGFATSAKDRIVTVHCEADNITLAAINADKAIKKISILYDAAPVALIKYYFRKISNYFFKFHTLCTKRMIG